MSNSEIKEPIFEENCERKDENDLEINKMESGENTKNKTMEVEFSKKCCFVELKPGISIFNLLTLYLVQFSYVCGATFIDACQGYLLRSDFYKIKEEEIGSVSGDLILYDEIYLIIFIYLYGAFHDVFGRKIIPKSEKQRFHKKPILQLTI
jgi:hypothetical protein